MGVDERNHQFAPGLDAEIRAACVRELEEQTSDLKASLRYQATLVELRANVNSISHRCHLSGVAFAWELTKETIHLPLGWMPGAAPRACGSSRSNPPTSAPPSGTKSTLQATQGQMDGFYSQFHTYAT